MLFFMSYAEGKIILFEMFLTRDIFDACLRVPKYNPETLTRWYCSDIPARTAHVLRYFSERTCMVLEMLNEIDMVTKTACAVSSFIQWKFLTLIDSEFARVFGVDFFSVISRGSQFKVESFMSRIAKPESFVLLSPSKQDVSFTVGPTCAYSSTLGWQAKCGRVYATYLGTFIGIL
jgi:hypothetical protein